MTDEEKTAKPEDCLAGGGEMGALMRSAEICRIRAEQKGIELIYETLTPLPKAIRADKFLKQY